MIIYKLIVYGKLNIMERPMVRSRFDLGCCGLHTLSYLLSCPHPPHRQEGLIPAHIIFPGCGKVPHVVVAVAVSRGQRGLIICSIAHQLQDSPCKY